MADSDRASWERFNKRMAAIPLKVRAALKPAIEKSANELVKKMQSNAPQETGALIESIKATQPEQTTPAYSLPSGQKTAGELQAIVTVGDAKVRYAHLVEYGTSKATAQPFFWPAARELNKRIKGRIKRTINKAVKETK